MKTIICDIDGTIFKYPPRGSAQVVNEDQELLPGVLHKFNRWEAAGHRIILITGRRESLRKCTEAILTDNGIPFDQLIMGCPDEGRVLINDLNFAGKVKAHAVNLERDIGMEHYDWMEVGL
jgi:hypothetical protein